ncbi:DUF4942 domain-containing protein [Salmonella enterica]|nr:DUF4942 domain-containing protein [Salmonella enterica subsp. enterica serovar Chester]EGI6490506.1 DUF4942 domain-containing protein [Salmonella enterica subsp. enterica serovar Hvittingfoss]EIF2862136.1 DUF4942 domain-containing protein [Salmonella enterica]
MKQTMPATELNTASTTEVIPSVAIDRIIAQRNEGIALFMQAIECLESSRKILREASGHDFLYGFEDAVTDAVRRADKPEENRKNISRFADRKIWHRLMTDTGMYTFMSSCQCDEWNKQLKSETCPEITLDNVLATFRHMNARKMQTFEQGLIDVYRNLSWDYKTNNPCRLGKRIIVSNLLYRWSDGHVSLDHSGREKIDDLARPFYLLEGRNIPDFRHSTGTLYSDFLGAGINVGELFDGEYFTVRGFLKGTVHITFKSPDLVEKLNDIIARHYPGALPPRV